MSAFGQMADVGDWRNVRVPASMRRGRSPPQSSAPGFDEKYCSLSGFPSHSLESIGGAFFTVIFGQIFAYFAFSDSHSSSPGSVSGFMALSWSARGAGRRASLFALAGRASPRRAPELGTDRAQLLHDLCLSSGA